MFIGFYFVQCPLGQYFALGHTDDGVAKAANEIHIVFNHDKGVSTFLVQADDCVTDCIQQRAVNGRVART